MGGKSLLAACGAAVLLMVNLAHADTLDEIRKRGEMVVGMEAALVPYEFFSDGQIVGYDIDIAQRIADKMGVKVRFVDTAWNGIIPALYVGKFDTIMSAMVMTRDRAEKVLFAMPYSEASTVIVRRAGDTAIKVAEDYAGRNVAVQLGSASDVTARKFEARLKEAGKPGFADYKQYEHLPEAYLDLTNGHVDGVFATSASALVVMKAQPGRYALVYGVLKFPIYTGYAFRKEDTALVGVVNAELAQMKADGSLAALQTKWFGQTMETPNAVPDTLP